MSANLGTDAGVGDLQPSLKAWAEGALSSEIVGVMPIVGGASRTSAVLRTADGGQAFLRREAGTGPLANTPFTLAREYAVLRLLNGSSVPVPAVFAFSAQEDAMLMAVVPGVTSYERSFSEAEEAPLRRELMAAVVALQSIPPGDVPELAADPEMTLGETIRADLRLWRTLYETRVAVRDPLIDLALDWLESAVPDADSAPVIVHGDIGPGNFLINNGHVAAVIDWEMVRLGHPLEDVACVVARALGAPFGTASEHLATYSELSGRIVDAAKLDHALVLVMVRWTIAISIGLSRPSATQNVAMLFAFRHINGRAILGAMARRAGVPYPAEVSSVVEPVREAVRPALAHVRSLIDEFTVRKDIAAGDRDRLSNAAGLLTYLDALTRHGTDRYDADETSRIAVLLNRPFGSLREANDALCAQIKNGSLRDNAALFDHLLWRNERDQTIMAEFLGPRANATIDLTKRDEMR